MRKISLCSSKWQHFEDREFIVNLMLNKEDINLIGPPRSGKTEVIRDLSQNCAFIKINCFNHCKMLNFRKDVIKKMTSFLDIKVNLTNFSSFINYIKENKGSGIEVKSLKYFVRQDIRIVFENAQHLLTISKEGAIEFFLVFKKFLQEISDFIAVQTIIVSTVFFPVDCFKVYLPFPSIIKIKEKINDVINNSLHKKPKYPLICKHYKATLVSAIIGYNTVVADFDSFEIITRQLAYFLEDGMRQSQNKQFDQIDIKHFSDYHKTTTLFFSDIKQIYASIYDLKDQIQHINVNDQTVQKDYELLTSGNCPQKDIMNLIPIIPCYALLACYMAANHPDSKDKIILGLIKRSFKANESQSNVKNTSKSFGISRAIWIMEALILNQIEKEKVNDLLWRNHTNEFYLSFNFLEKLNWIKEVSNSATPLKYQFTCDQQFVNKVINRLGFNKDEFLVVN
jgi:hypothetical protein